MARYMIQETFTPQVIAALMKNPEDRTEPIRTIFEAAGGKLEHYFVSISENTVFLVADFPDQESCAAVSWAIFAGGALSAIKVTPIVTATEAVDLMKKAASVAYRPPGK